jgi:hypothetical protein
MSQEYHQEKKRYTVRQNLISATKILKEEQFKGSRLAADIGRDLSRTISSLDVLVRDLKRSKLDIPDFEKNPEWRTIYNRIHYAMLSLRHPVRRLEKKSDKEGNASDSEDEVEETKKEERPAFKKLSKKE